MFSECKIFFGENILRKGKYFLSFDCIVEIIPKNYFLCLVLHVKNLFLEKVNTSHWPPPPNTQNPDRKEEKNYTTTPLPPKHHHSHHHHNNKIKNQRNRKSITKISEGGGGLVRVWEKKWDEKEKTTVEWCYLGFAVEEPWRLHLAGSKRRREGG